MSRGERSRCRFGVRRREQRCGCQPYRKRGALRVQAERRQSRRSPKKSKPLACIVSLEGQTTSIFVDSLPALSLDRLNARQIEALAKGAMSGTRIAGTAAFS